MPKQIKHLPDMAQPLKRSEETAIRVLPVDSFERDLIFAFRYAYYCLGRSIVTDYHYDHLEKEYLLANGGAELPVGSSNKEDYTEAQRALAMYFLFSGRSTAPSKLSAGPKFF